MTREEAIKILREDGCGYCTWQSINPYECENKECNLKEALDMAIQALSQEPCTDAVSREAVKETLRNRIGESISECINAILPINLIRCDDAISREAVQTELKNCEVVDVRDENDNLIGYYNADTVDSIVRNSQPVTPSRQWIPVSERLPEENETVLINYCRLNEHSVRMAIWDELHCRFYNSEYTKYVSVDFVTAWMPLPKPYGAEMESAECIE